MRSIFRRFGLLPVALCVAVAAPAQTTYYVQAGAPLPWLGTAAQPFAYIGDALYYNAVSGDTILVGPGTYNECVDFMGKDLEIRSTHGAAVTAISGWCSVSFVMGEGPGARLVGFTVRDQGDGGIAVFGSSPTVEDCVITQNFGTYITGGVHCHFAAPVFRRCDIVENYGNGYEWTGSGVRLFHSPAARFENCRIMGNVGGPGSGDTYGKYSCSGGNVGTFAGVSSFGPGPVLAGAATYFQFVNCLIAGNVGGLGDVGGFGGGAGVSGAVTLANCTIVGNVGGAGGAADVSLGMCPSLCPGGGGWAGVFGGAYLRNCIVRDNVGGALGTGTIPGGGCTAGPGVSDALVVAGIEFSNVKGVVGGVGNFDVDPQLVDYRPTAASPGVDAGTNLVAGMPVADLDGQPRVRHLVVDQGAYESAGTTYRGAVGLSAGAPIPTLTVNGSSFAAATTPGSSATVAVRRIRGSFRDARRPPRRRSAFGLSRRGAPTCACRGASRRGAGCPWQFERRRRDPRRARPRPTPTCRGGRDKSALHGSTLPVANPERS
jgi:hypothetical protein